MPSWPPPVYEITAEFRAPIGYVFRWCTDYRTDDARRDGERYERRILARSSRRVVFEDLWSERDGWRWRRYDVSLFPPRRWRADTVGNVRDATIDYRLYALPDGGTRLRLRMRRRPGPRLARQPPKAELEAELVRLWGRLGRSLESDYRRSTRRRGRARRG